MSEKSGQHNRDAIWREILIKLCVNYPDAVAEIKAIEGEIYHAYADLLWGVTPGFHVLWRTATDEFATRVRLEKAD